MKVRVESDGTPRGTTITDLATGQRLDFVSGIVWQLDGDGRTGLVLRVVDSSQGGVSIEGTATCEIDGHYARRLMHMERHVKAAVLGLTAERDRLEELLPPSLFHLLKPLIAEGTPG